jgi:hypothetical protein
VIGNFKLKEGKYMGNDIEFWSTLKERGKFFIVVIFCIIFDSAFFLVQKLLVIGCKWCSEHISTLTTSSDHANQLSVGIHSYSLLEYIFDWATFLVVVLFVLQDVYKMAKKIFVMSNKA